MVYGDYSKVRALIVPEKSSVKSSLSVMVKVSGWFPNVV